MKMDEFVRINPCGTQQCRYLQLCFCLISLICFTGKKEKLNLDMCLPEGVKFSACIFLLRRLSPTNKTKLRRKFLSLVQVYKIIFGLCNIDAATYFDIVRESRTRSNHKFNFKPNYARTNYFKFSFFDRYINDWNSLPSDVLEAQSLILFKKKLLNHLMSEQYEYIYVVVQFYPWFKILIPLFWLW